MLSKTNLNYKSFQFKSMQKSLALIHQSKWTICINILSRVKMNNLTRSSKIYIGNFISLKIRNTRVYEGLVKMLSFDAEMGTSENQQEDKTQINLLIKKIYRIMTKACKENFKNKLLMTDHLEEVILYHFNDCQNSGYDNNSYFLLNELVIGNFFCLIFR